MWRSFGTVLSVVTLLAGSARADVTAPPQPAIPKDAQGTRGLSPTTEALLRGDRAYLSQNFPEAIQAYSEAIRLSPDDPRAYLRVAQTQARQDQLPEALQSGQLALTKATQSPTLRAKILFFLADLNERLRASEAAVAAWTAYAEHLTSAKIPGFPDTAAERKQRASTWTESVAQYGEVKKRILARQQEPSEKH